MNRLWALLVGKVRQAKAGTGQQIFIADQISTGAVSFLTTEYNYLAYFVVACAVFIVSVLEGQKAGVVVHALDLFIPLDGRYSLRSLMLRVICLLTDHPVTYN